jgi:hypothetical protein
VKPQNFHCATLHPATALYGTVALSFVIPGSRLAVCESGEKRQSMCPLQYRRVKSKGAPGLAFETWDPSNQFPLETPTLLFVIRSSRLAWGKLREE